MRIRNFLYSIRELFYDLLWLIAVFAFGWTYQKYQELNKFYVSVKTNAKSVYQRKIYKEQDFIFT